MFFRPVETTGRLGCSAALLPLANASAAPLRTAMDFCVLNTDGLFRLLVLTGRGGRPACALALSSAILDALDGLPRFRFGSVKSSGYWSVSKLIGDVYRGVLEE